MSSSNGYAQSQIKEEFFSPKRKRLASREWPKNPHPTKKDLQIPLLELDEAAQSANTSRCYSEYDSEIAGEGEEHSDEKYIFAQVHAKFDLNPPSSSGPFKLAGVKEHDGDLSSSSWVSSSPATAKSMQTSKESDSKSSILRPSRRGLLSRISRIKSSNIFDADNTWTSNYSSSNDDNELEGEVDESISRLLSESDTSMEKQRALYRHDPTEKSESIQQREHHALLTENVRNTFTKSCDIGERRAHDTQMMSPLRSALKNTSTVPGSQPRRVVLSPSFKLEEFGTPLTEEGSNPDLDGSMEMSGDVDFQDEKQMQQSTDNSETFPNSDCVFSAGQLMQYRCSNSSGMEEEDNMSVQLSDAILDRMR
jgi:hypothetical protein